MDVSQLPPQLLELTILIMLLVLKPRIRSPSIFGDPEESPDWREFGADGRGQEYESIVIVNHP